jgi:hypothetical protein
MMKYNRTANGYRIEYIQGITQAPPQTTRTVFAGFASKPVATVSWLSLKTKVVEGFPVWASKSAALVW